jgi:hypothetical protein
VWAAACFAVALPWYLVGNGLDLVPFLFTLVGGWSCGHGFVNATMRMSPPLRGAIVHLAGAVLAAAAIGAVVFGDKGAAAALPDALSGVYLLVQMAAIPAVAWTWLALLSRAIGALPGPRPRAALAPPAWQRDGDGSILRFRAIPLRMPALAGRIAALVVVVGAVVTLGLIVTGDFAERAGPRIVVILVGALVALPAYLLFLAVVRRRTAACTVRFGDDRVRLEIGTERHDLRWLDVDLLRWRRDGDYARLELRGRDDGNGTGEGTTAGTGNGTAVGVATKISLITGLTRPRNAVAPQLPGLPPRVVRALESAGLHREPSRRPTVETFRRHP